MNTPPPDQWTSHPAAGDVPVHAADQTAHAADQPAHAADQTVQRVDESLSQLEDLVSLLDEPQRQLPPPDYEVPASFLLSVVIPVYNEETTLYQLLARVAALPVPTQIVLVDDCSTDGTRALLRRLESVEQVTVLYHDVNQGKGAALRTGFAAAKGSIVVIQDGDLEYDPADIPALLGPILRGEADVVYGSRFLGPEHQDPSFIHRLGNQMLTWASNRFTGLELTDMETCYKAFRREQLQQLEMRQNRFGFEPEVTAKLARRGCRFAEVPIGYQARSYAEGKKIGVKDLFNAMYCIVRYGLRD